MPKETAAGRAPRGARRPTSCAASTAPATRSWSSPARASRRASRTRQFAEAGATLGDPWGADVVAKVAAPTEAEIGRLSARLGPDRLPRPAHQRPPASRRSPPPARRVRDGGDPADLARAVDGRAVLARRRSPATCAVLIAAAERPRFFPMLMTAAGTIPPAQVLVLGAGVAGLQAIATARRLGAVVTAFDVRSRRQGADPVAGREVLRGRGARRRRGQRRLRARADGRGAGDPAPGADGADGQVRRDHHDRARARAARRRSSSRPRPSTG